MNQNKILKVIVLILILLLLYQVQEIKNKETIQYEVNTDNTQICFTPKEKCVKHILEAIKKAKKYIYVQAYGFTSKSIISEIINAKNRGVDVILILDKSNINMKNAKIDLFYNNIEIYFDKKAKIAHNKVIIIDDNLVITGSYNFTESAEKYNAENLLIISNKKIAERYKSNFFDRKIQSVLYIMKSE